VASLDVARENDAKTTRKRRDWTRRGNDAWWVPIPFNSIDKNARSSISIGIFYASSVHDFQR